MKIQYGRTARIASGWPWTTAATPAVSRSPANIHPNDWLRKRVASSELGRTPSCDGMAPYGLLVFIVRSSWRRVAVVPVVTEARTVTRPAPPLGRAPTADQPDGSGTVANAVPESIPPNPASPPFVRPV